MLQCFIYLTLLCRAANLNHDFNAATSRCKTLQHCDSLQHTTLHYNTLRYTVTHCNTLHYSVAHCTALQNTGTYCITLHHTSDRLKDQYNTLRYTAKHWNILRHISSHRWPPKRSQPWLVRGQFYRATVTRCKTLQDTATHNTLQHTATHCNAPQHTTTHCSALQHTATHCNTMQTLHHTGDRPKYLNNYLYEGYKIEPPPGLLVKKFRIVSSLINLL